MRGRPEDVRAGSAARGAEGSGRVMGQVSLPRPKSLPHQAGVGGEKAGRPDLLADWARRKGRTLDAFPDATQTRPPCANGGSGQTGRPPSTV